MKYTSFQAGYAGFANFLAIRFLWLTYEVRKGPSFINGDLCLTPDGGIIRIR